MSLQKAISEAERAQAATPTHKPVGMLLPGFVVTALFVVLAVVGRGCFGRSDDPFRYVRVSGKVCYEGGARIPAKGLVLTFLPVETVSVSNKFARPGIAIVDDKTAEFQSATTRKPNDGIVFGRHRVILSVSNREHLPDDVVPAIYKDQARSPLEVDTRSQPFDIRIARPKTP